MAGKRPQQNPEKASKVELMRLYLGNLCTIPRSDDRDLWCAVLQQAIWDYHGRMLVDGRVNGKTLRKDDAIDFINDSGRHTEICELVGIDPGIYAKVAKGSGNWVGRNRVVR